MPAECTAAMRALAMRPAMRTSALPFGRSASILRTTTTAPLSITVACRVIGGGAKPALSFSIC